MLGIYIFEVRYTISYMVTWEQKSVKQGGRDRKVRQGGNRDGQRRVREGSEIEWR